MSARKRRLKKPDADHVIVDAVGQCMRCERCGEEVPFPLGLVDWTVKVGDAFVDAHRNCTKPGGDARCYFSTIVPKAKRVYPAKEGA